MFATCSFPEYHPSAVGGVPVRSSNGFPRYKLRYPLLYAMPSTFPRRAWMKLPYEQFYPRYADMIAANEEQIRREAEQIREQAGVVSSTPLVLLCFEQLAKNPGSFCHRRIFAAAWEDITGERVVELGAMPIAETRAQQEGLF